jgi:hypothetical protein
VQEVKLAHINNKKFVQLYGANTCVLSTLERLLFNISIREKKLSQNYFKTFIALVTNHQNKTEFNQFNLNLELRALLGYTDAQRLYPNTPIFEP